MTESSDPSEEINNSDEVGNETEDTCPACGTSQLQDLSPVPNPVCSECGFVTGTEAGIPAESSKDNTDDSAQKKSWSEYCSVTNSTEKQVATALEQLEQLAETLLLDEEIRLQIADVYAGAAEENVTDGRPTRLIVAAAICIGTREANVPRPSERVAEAAEIQPARIKKAIRVFQEELNRGYTGVSARNYVPYLCDDIGLAGNVESRAIRVIDQLEDQSQTATHPAGIAGAAIYIAADGAVTQRQIAAVAGVTKETIRVRLSDLREVVSV